VLISIPLTVDPAVVALARTLRERALVADVQVLSLCGEPDVRLVACQEGGDVTVELLASPPPERPADRWHAVQVRGQERQVWRGPAYDAPTTEVASFVQALLAAGASRERYVRLG
jgi:hypothetical protein